MLGSYKHVGIAAHGILRKFNWNTVMLLYHNHDEASGKGNSDCYFTLGGIYRFLNQSSQEQFDEEKTTRNDFLKLLEKVKKKARSEFNISIQSILTIPIRRSYSCFST